LEGKVQRVIKINVCEYLQNYCINMLNHAAASFYSSIFYNARLGGPFRVKNKMNNTYSCVFAFFNFAGHTCCVIANTLGLSEIFPLERSEVFDREGCF